MRLYYNDGLYWTGAGELVAMARPDTQMEVPAGQLSVAIYRRALSAFDYETDKVWLRTLPGSDWRYGWHEPTRTMIVAYPNP